MTGDSPYRSLRVLGQWLVGLLVLGLVVDLASFVVELNYHSALSKLERGLQITIDEANAADNSESAASIAQLAVSVATIVVWIVWFARAYRNLEAFGTPNLMYKYGWSIGAWFVPFMNLVRPKEIADDIWRASDPGLPRGAPDWEKMKVPALMHWWWGIWLITAIFGNVGARIYLRADTLHEQVTASTLSWIADLGYVVAAVFAILVVRTITERQEGRAQAPASQPPPPPPPPSTPVLTKSA